MKMSNTEFTKAFNETYKMVATTGIYSMELANKIGYGNGVKAVDMPKEMSACVEKYGGGCCFHHSWRLIYELTKVGITAYWAVVPEPNENGQVDQKCVVVYETPDGSRYVADIVEDIKAGVKATDFIGDGCKWINSRGEIVDNSKIDLKEMARISNNPIVSGYLKIYPKPDDTILFRPYSIEADCEVIEMDNLIDYNNTMDDFGTASEDSYVGDERTTRKRVDGENTMDNFGKLSEDSVDEDETTGDDGTGSFMSIMDVNINNMGMSM